MKFINKKITGLKLIKTEIHNDKRGFLKEVYKQEITKKEKFIFKICITINCYIFSEFTEFICRANKY